MEKVIIAKGDGYAGCTAFDGYRVIAEPLPTREARVFPGEDGRPGITYASHSIKLAKRAGALGEGRDLFILLHHGGGRRVIRFRPCYDGGAAEAALVALPEAVLYSILYAMAESAQDADIVAREETAQKYASAFLDGRLRKSRVRQGRRTVTIAPVVATTKAQNMEQRR